MAGMEDASREARQGVRALMEREDGKVEPMEAVQAFVWIVAQLEGELQAHEELGMALVRAGGARACLCPVRCALQVDAAAQHAVAGAAATLFALPGAKVFREARDWSPLTQLAFAQDTAVRRAARRAMVNFLGLEAAAAEAVLNERALAASGDSERHREQVLQAAGDALAGNHMTVASDTQAEASLVVETDTTRANLNRMARAVSSGRPVLLQGRSGSGKSVLVNELARMHGKKDKLVELQLDDQMDSKTLLGTFVCTEVPGEFKWQPGALTQAVTKGCWVFIEDIDRAPFEVLAALVPLFESRRLLLPNRSQTIHAAPGFQVLATTKASVAGSPLIATSLWEMVRVDPLNMEELAFVARERFDALHSRLVDWMVQTFYAFAFPPRRNASAAEQAEADDLGDTDGDLDMTAGEEEAEDEVEDEVQPLEAGDGALTVPELPLQCQRAVPGRSVSERDLFKWLRRVDALVSLHSAERGTSDLFLTEREREGILSEAIDCFVAAMPSKETRSLTVRWLAKLWKLPEEQLLHRLVSYKPQVEPATDALDRVRVGRVELQRSNGGGAEDNNDGGGGDDDDDDNDDKAKQEGGGGSARVAPSGVSMRLLEQLSACVKLAEPVLLVGETGAGKTSMVQHLAKLMNKKIVVQNMHVQSDSTELLGGYKPVQLQHVARPLYERFVQLFCALFSESANQKFLLAVRSSLDKSRWKKLSKAFARACDMAAAKLSKRRAALPLEGEGDPAKKLQRTDAGVVDTSPPPATGAAADADAAGEGDDAAMRAAWDAFRADAEHFEGQRKRVETSFAFAFEEGALVRAIRAGHWVLLDEVNLASSETLERLNSLLDDNQGTLSLTERGDLEQVQRHPEFRLFAAMNPATDFGKKDLPPALRSRFTELYVDELVDPADLRLVVSCYLSDIPAPPVNEVVTFYLKARRRSEEHKLLDGANQPPRYSLRTLCRSLSTARLFLTRGLGLERSLYESFAMTFATLLNAASYKSMLKMVRAAFAPGVPSKRLEAAPKCPGGKSGRGKYVLCDKFWVVKGPRLLRDAAEALPEQRNDALAALQRQEDAEAQAVMDKFVVTPSVTTNVQSLARAIAAHKYPILLQGPTSSGKTTMVAYLAARTGHRCVRINNHEYTDLQEYMGSYVSDEKGSLVFQEGILVEAVRKGYWIVLDELNLAPSEVLEALNRLLDDNREIFIPETQELVKPHPNFMLFATQNPPGLYGGRKVLSKAFRNRFLELHVGEIPPEELETILNKRCALAPSFCKVLVAVMVELQMHRQQSRLFAGKEGFITPRDLLRWANRTPASYEELAVEGFRLLGDRVRAAGDKAVVRTVIEKHCKTKLTDELLYGGDENPLEAPPPDGMSAAEWAERAQTAGISRVVWTKAMKRTHALVRRCLENEEPVLLVGETGCGKTTVCQILALQKDQTLHILNCHQNTDTADILGNLRPVRGKAQILQQLQQLVAEATGTPVDALPVDATALEALMPADDGSGANAEQVAQARELARQHRAFFEWQDGPLVTAMRQGDMFLLDELSLAEDAVLERLNSVLEPSRTLFLAEKGGRQVEEIRGHELFRILSTMNPGGDYGKRELSPALRNRFTEIWIPPVADADDLRLILGRYLDKAGLADFASALVAFFHWFNVGEGQGEHAIIQLTLRDLISWASFLVTAAERDTVAPWQAYVHGAGLVMLDGLGLGSGIAFESCERLRERAYAFLHDQVPAESRAQLEHDLLLAQSVAGVQLPAQDAAGQMPCPEGSFGIHPFFTPLGPHAVEGRDVYALDAPTTALNLARVLRAMQLARPILLEGSPGVGKTSLISSLAQRSGHKLVRINLSEQTDFSDLIGSDIPAGSAEDGSGGARFVWSDGVFLAALKAGDWVLLDELNLASQSVLEGLNACLDHRSTVYVPELDQEFHCPPSFRVFAAQNPVQQGGGRKGLPKSFLNRFTKVFVDSLTEADYGFIIQRRYPDLPIEVVGSVVAFNTAIVSEIVKRSAYGRKGAPWEFNLRDIFRLCEIAVPADGACDPARLADHVAMVYFDRMRTEADRVRMRATFDECFAKTLGPWRQRRIEQRLSPDAFAIGGVVLSRARRALPENEDAPPFVPRACLPALEHVAGCVAKAWPVLLVGASGTGKTTVVRYLAQMCGRRLHEFAVTSSTDSTELLGCFEQVDAERASRDFAARLSELVSAAFTALFEAATAAGVKKTKKAKRLLAGLEASRHRLQAQQATLEVKELALTQAGDALRLVPGAVDGELGALHSKLSEDLAEWQRRAEEVPGGEEATAGAFEWVDGTLVRAMEQGDWVLLNNANLCNPTVLDRLNPVLEMGGELLINECGMVHGEPRIIRPHPDFRVFFVADPQFGELSRAMRNRCVEVCLLEPSRVDMATSGDGARLLRLHGVPEELAETMLTKLATFTPRAGRLEQAAPRALAEWARSLKSRLSLNAQELTPQQALEESFEAVFHVPFGVANSQEGQDAPVEVEVTAPSRRVEKSCSVTRDWRSEADLFALRQDAQFALLRDPALLQSLEQLALRASPAEAGLRQTFAAHVFEEDAANALRDLMSALGRHPLVAALQAVPTASGLDKGYIPLQRQLADPALYGHDARQASLGRLVALLGALAVQQAHEARSVSSDKDEETDEAQTLMQVALALRSGSLSRQDVPFKGADLFLPVLEAVDSLCHAALGFAPEAEQPSALEDPLWRLISTRKRMWQHLMAAEIDLDGGEDCEAGEAASGALAIWSVLATKCAKAARDVVAAAATAAAAAVGTGEPLGDAMGQLRHVLSRMDAELGAQSSRSASILVDNSAPDADAARGDGVQSYRLAKRLWKDSGHGKPMGSRALFEIAEQARKLARDTLLPGGEPFAQLVQVAHRGLLVSIRDKRILVDALCTLEWANLQPGAAASGPSPAEAAFRDGATLKECLDKLESELARRQELIRNNPTLHCLVDAWALAGLRGKSLEQLGEERNSATHGASWRWNVLVQLQPLVDHWVCRRQASVIRDAVTAGPDEDGAGLALRALRAVDYSLETGSLSPERLSAWQDWAWRVQRGACAPSDLVGHGPGDAVLAAHFRALWRGAFNNRDAVDADAAAHLNADLSRAGGKGGVRGPSQEVVARGPWGVALTRGHARLYQDVESVLAFRLLRGSGVGLDCGQPRDRVVAPYGAPVALRDRAPKLAQLDMVLSHLTHAHSAAGRSLDTREDALKAGSALVRAMLASTRASVLAATGCDSLGEVPGLAAETLAPAEEALNELESMDASGQEAAAAQGRVWVLLSLFRLHSLVPNVSIDPSVKLEAKLGLQQSALEATEAQLEQVAFNDRVGGASAGPSEHGEQPLATRAKALRASKARLESKVIFRPGQSVFRQFMAEVSSFCGTLGGVAFVRKLLDALLAGSGHALAEESMWQDSALQVCQQLEERFGGYEDLTQPFLLALYQLKHGLRMVAAARHAKPRARDTALANVRRVLGSFPSSSRDLDGVQQASHLHALESVLGAKPHMDRRAWTKCLRATFERALAFLATKQQAGAVPEANVAGSGAAEQHTRSTEWVVLDEIIGAFAEQYQLEEDERRKRAEEEAEAVKYKMRQHGPEAENELSEEAAFRAMFPDFHAEFHQVTQSVLDEIEGNVDLEDEGKTQNDGKEDDDDEDDDDEGKAKQQRLVGVDKTAYMEIAQRACNFMLLDGAGASKPAGEAEAEEKRNALLAAISCGYHAAGCFDGPMEHCEGDAALLGGHLLALSQAIRDLQRKTAFDLKPTLVKKEEIKKEEGAEEDGAEGDGMELAGAEAVPQKVDLHRAAFVEEVVLMEAPLERLSMRLDALLREWPENAVLLQLARLTMRLRELPVSCPLMRALVGVETLLRVANDWETVAHRKVSIATELQPLIRLVLRWRRLELESWPFVLSQRERAVQQEAKLWFFGVYRIVGSEAEEGLASSVFASLDQFARTASLGTFATRLQLLTALRRLLERRGFRGDAAKVALLWHLEQYYAQWAADVRATMEREMAPIRRKLKDHTKLARWDDRNYFALKESADKSHRVLHRLARSFDEVLEQVAYSTIEFVQDSRTKSKQAGLKGQQLLVELDDIPDVRKRFACPSSRVLALAEAPPALPDALLDTPGGLGARLPKIVKRMITLCSRDVMRVAESEAWAVGMDAPRYLNESIVQRIQSLRKGKAPQSAKQKALVDLFKGLREHGLSRARPDNKLLFHEEKGPMAMHRLFTVAPVAPEAIKAAGAGQEAAAAWARFNRDYFKSLAQLQRLRHTTLAGGWSPEIPANLLLKALRVSEHVFELAVDQRIAAGDLVSRQRALGESVSALQSLAGRSGAVPDGLAEQVGRLGDSLGALGTGALEFDVLQSGLASLDSPAELQAFLRQHGATESARIVELRAETARSGRSGEVSVAIKALAEEFVSLGDRLGGVARRCARGFLSEADLEALSNFVSGWPALEGRLVALRKSCRWVPAQVLDTLVCLADSVSTLRGEVTAAMDARAATKPVSAAAQAGQLAAVDECIEGAMITVQRARDLVAALRDTGADGKATSSDADEDEGETICEHAERLCELMKLLSNAELGARVDQALAALADLCARAEDAAAATAARGLVQGVAQLLDTLYCLGADLLGKAAAFCGNLAHLEFLLLRVFRTVAANGLCKPAEEDDEEGGDEGDDGNEGEGTGMGDGKGREDVSDEIDDEEQLLGVKKDREELEQEKQEEKQEEKEEKGDDGLEMENDFDGELFDAEAEKEEDDDDKDDKDEEELDREMGDLEREDEHVVDEKLWDEDDEDEEDKQEEDETFEKDAPMAGDNDEDDELRAKEDDEQEQKKGDEEDPSKKKNPDDNDDEDEDGADGADQQEDEELEDPVDDGEDVEDRHQDVPRGGDEVGEDEQQAEEEDFELPDDMQIDDGDGGDEGDENEEGDEPMDLEGGEDEEGDKEDDASEGSGDEESEAGSDAPDDGDPETETDPSKQQDGTAVEENDKGPDEEDEEEGEKEEGEEEEEEDKGPKLNLPDNSQEDDPEQMDRAFGTDAPKAGEEDEDADEHEARGNSAAQDDEQKEEREDSQAGQSAGASQQQASDANTEWVPEEREGADDGGDENDEDDEASIDADTGGDRMERERANPWNNSGSASEAWHKRLEMISQEEKGEDGQQEQEQEDEEQQAEDKGGADDAEEDRAPQDAQDRVFDFSSSRDEATDQVLAPSQQQPENDKAMEEDEDNAAGKEEEKEEEAEAAEENEAKRALREEEPAPDSDAEDKGEERSKREREDQAPRRKKPRLENGSDEQDREKGLDGADPDGEGQDELEEGAVAREHTVETNAEKMLKKEDAEMGAAEDGDADLLAADEEAEAEAAEKAARQNDGGADDAAFARWNALAGDTMESSQRLCEQLRLLLEPTMATKLRGDYRTGKRINMRRVIPYIASQFRKDKIWLRRTKPSKREYQVLLALDDSRSMAQSGDLALNALATITKALTKLEVGQVGVVSFGEEARTVHDLQTPFTDVSGAQVVSTFGFKQEHTAVEAGIGKIVRLFEDARGELGAAASASAGRTEFRQLAFFISDGRFDSAARARVERMIREAAQRRMLIVLLIVEAPGQETILETRQASFSKSGSLKMSNYLDDYPFPLYVVLEDMEALPEVLSDALRQWFELLSSSSD